MYLLASAKRIYYGMGHKIEGVVPCINVANIQIISTYNAYNYIKIVNGILQLSYW